MKLKHIQSLTLGACLIVTSAFAEEKPMELKTQEQKLGYILGQEVGHSIKEIKNEIDLSGFLKGVEDAVLEKPLLVQVPEGSKIKEEFMNKKRAEHMKKMQAMAEQNKKTEQEFLAKNKTEKGVVTTASGLQYLVITEGTGETPVAESKVIVNYTGTLLDGTEFDSSIKRGQPATFQVSQVIPGWGEALKLMKAGGEYKLFIPSSLAYSDKGAGPKIPPYATLIFEVELVSVGK